MRQLTKATTAAIAGLGALAMFGAPSVASTDQRPRSDAGSVQIAHMNQPQGGQPGQPCPMGMMGRGMMGQGMMGQGMMGRGMGGQGTMGPGMMGRGMGGQGMMGPGMMGPGMGGQGTMGSGMMGPRFGHRVVPTQDLSVDDVRHYFQDRLAMHGNERLKVGDVKEADDGTIVADIVTVDGSLVERFNVNRHTGALRRAK